MEDAATAAKPAISATKTAIVDSLPPDPIAAGLEALCRQQILLRKERKDLTRQVKNAKKKVARLKLRGRQLSDDDLVAVLMMRKGAASAKAEPSAGSEASTAASSSSSSSGDGMAFAGIAANATEAAAAASALADEDGMARED